MPGRSQWPEPGIALFDLLAPVERHITGLENFEAHVLQGFSTDTRVDNVGKTVADFDVLFDLAVVSVFLVVLVREAPFVACEGGAWLEHAQDLVVYPGAVRSVAGALDGE